MASVQLRNVTKAWGDVVVSKDINLDIHEGEFVVFVGPSGCGKSTLLRMIAGLETITSGDLLIGDTRMNDIPPAERGVGMVFQSYALYPHLSVAENMSFGLKLAGAKKEVINQRVTQVAEVLQLAHLLERKPKALSGGQRQRVAIGRTLVAEPRVFLLDEPLSNLDAALRGRTRIELAQLHQRVKATMIFVTHDQEEALTMSDTIVVMNGGYIQQIGTPEDIYNEPQNAFVADFIGDSNLLGGTMIQDRLVEILGAKFLCVDEGFGTNNPVDVVIRPEDVELVKPEHLIVDKNLPQTQLAANEYVAREYATFWNTGKESLARDALAINFIDKTPPKGRRQGPEGAILASRAFRAAVPDLRCDVEQILFQAIAWFRIYIFTARSPEHLAS
mgnify:CR=1 FL=1